MNPDLPMPVAPPTGSVRRFTVAALLSALAGLLVPKCPLCLAAYLSAAGVGVSFAQGAAPILLRVANGVVATALSWLAARVVLRMWKNGPAVRDQSNGLRKPAFTLAPEKQSFDLVTGPFDNMFDGAGEIDPASLERGRYAARE